MSLATPDRASTTPDFGGRSGKGSCVDALHLVSTPARAFLQPISTLDGVTKPARYEGMGTSIGNLCSVPSLLPRESISTGPSGLVRGSGCLSHAPRLPPARKVYQCRTLIVASHLGVPAASEDRLRTPVPAALVCYNNLVDRNVRWFRSARRHRIGKAHAMYVLSTTDPVRVRATTNLDARLVWVGADDRGIELEIVALDLPEAIVVIHVMPTALRR